MFDLDGTSKGFSDSSVALVEMAQHRLRAVIVLTLVVAGLAQAEPKWVKLRSANFELYTSAGERAGRRTIQQFERTGSFFQQAMQLEESNSKPVRIVLFRSKKEYSPYRPGEVADAYYLSTRDADLIVLVAGSELSVAIHEYVHLLVRHSGLRLPLWINEGLADLYSSLRQVGGRVVVGHVPPAYRNLTSGEMGASRTGAPGRSRLATLHGKGARWEILRRELGADPHAEPLERVSVQLWEVLEALTAGKSSVAALEAVYGMPIENLQKELRSYVQQDRLSGLVFDIKLEKSAEQPSAEPATGLEVGLLLADLLAGTKKTEAARAMYEKVSSENPEAPGPYEALGYLEYRLGDKDQARIQFGRAFELGSKNPRVLRLYGRTAERSRRRSDRADAREGR